MFGSRAEPAASTGPTFPSGVFERLARNGQHAASVAEFRNAILQEVVCTVGADSSSFMDPPQSMGSWEARRAVALGSSVAYVPHYTEQRLRYETSLARMLEATFRHGLAIDTEIYARRERERLAAYVEVLIPQGARSILAAAITYRGRPSGLIVLKRHGSGSAFRKRDETVLRGLLPVIALADAGFQFSIDKPCTNPGGTHLVRLSPRESQIAALLVKGMQNGEIAMILGTSRHTVKKQVQRIFAKFAVSNRTELAGLLGAAA